jgi:hypothetical protein
MPCNQDCEQGRKCNCDRSGDRAVVIVATLLLIAIVSMGFGFYKLLSGNAGQECEITFQFKDSKATYIGKTV